MEGEGGGTEEGGWWGVLEAGACCVWVFFFSSGGERRGWWDAGFDWRLWIAGLGGWVGDSMSGARGVEGWGFLLGNIEVACGIFVVTVYIVTRVMGQWKEKTLGMFWNDFGLKVVDLIALHQYLS